MWADAETSIDYINYTETAEIAADLISQKEMLPLSLGVFGGWGAGKSSMLRLIQHELRQGDSKTESKFIIVEFDAWLFQDYDDARASLMEIIARTLIQEAKSNKSLMDKAKDLLKKVNYLRAIGTSVEIGASLALGIPPLGLFKRGLDAVDILFSNDENGKEEAFKDAKAIMKESADYTKGFIKNNPPSPPQQIIAFRSKFADILKELDKTLVVFIDNIDRCLPDVAIETLEAIRLFIFLDNTAFVIAADEDMIRTSVRKHYDGIDSQHITDYLDKLIQVPIKVPLLGGLEVQSYLSLLFIASDREGEDIFDATREYLRQQMLDSWKNGEIDQSQLISTCKIKSSSLKTSLDLACRLAPLLASAPNINGNPRIIKRLLNTVKMRVTIARKRKMPIDEAMLIKLAIFERCVTARSYELLAMFIHESPEGKPLILKQIEDVVEDKGKFDECLPEEWKQYNEFLYKWFQLNPKLSERDLRPAIYLSRESIRLIPENLGLSLKANILFKNLMSIRTVTSVTVKDLIKTTSDEDKKSAMIAIIGELRKVTDWTQQVQGFCGAVCLANTTPSLGEHLLLFLNDRPKESVGSWAYPLLRKAEWAKDMLSHWEESKKNPIKSFKLK